MSLQSVLPLLLDLLLKSSAVLLLAFLAHALCRRASAANRHAIWAAALAVLLLLPVSQCVTPRWAYVWKGTATPAPVVHFTATPSRVAVSEPVLAPPPVASPAAPIVLRKVNWPAAVVAVWLLGIVLVIGRRAAVSAGLHRIVRRSRSVADARVLTLAAPLGVEVRESVACRVPLVCGVVRPVVLLPLGARDWSTERLAAALQHEFGHIRRRDCLTRLLLDLACALYWMNPLIWLAARSMRVAQEQACDDLVLRHGASAEDYATQLVEVVRGLGADAFPVRHALAMAQPSTLETRVRAIVDARCDRSTLSRATSVLGTVAAALVVALCGVVRVEGAGEKPAAKPAAGGEEPGVQILIEAKFFEVAEESLGALGASLGVKEMPASVDARGGIAAVLTAVQAAESLKSLEKLKGVDLLSTPRLTTRSGQKAVIEIAREFRYPTEYEKDDKTGRWVPITFATKNLGVTFGILAIAAADGTLDLELKPELVELKGFTDLDAPGQPLLPAKSPAGAGLHKAATPEFRELVPAGRRAQAVFSTRQINTSISIFPGQTVVLEAGQPKEVKDAPKRRLFVLVTAEVLKPKVAARSVVITSDRITVDQATGAVTASGDVKVETADATIVAQNVEVRPNGVAAAPPKSAAEEKAEKIILPKIELSDASVRDAVTFLTRKSSEIDPAGKGVNVALKLPSGDATTLTLSLENVPFTEALKYVAQLAGLKLDATADGFLIHGGEKPAPLAEPAAGSPESALLNRARGLILPRVEFKDAKVDESAEFFRRKSAEIDLEKKPVNIVVQHGKSSREVRVSLSLTNVSVAAALEYFASLAGMKLEVGPSALVLRQPAE